MTDLAPLPPALEAELDDVLSLLPLVDAQPAVADAVFGRLAEALALAVVHDVRARHRAGRLGRTEYMVEICQVVRQLQDRGLLRRR